MWTKVALGMALLAAVLLPLNLLASQPFHHDEALYATWALQVVSGHDFWLAQTPVDKPPLFLYTVAGVMKLLGVSQTTARLPSLLATVVTVGLTFRLGQKLYSTGVGLLAAWLVALSPFTILFAPTALTDPMLVALVLAGCLAAVQGRAVWAGLALGLAIATKQQGLFFVPLALALLVGSLVSGGQAAAADADDRRRTADGEPGRLPAVSRLASLGRPGGYFWLALILALLPLLVWDAWRSTTTEFLRQSVANYGGLSGDPAGFGLRWWGFIELLRYGTGSSLLNTFFLAGLPLLWLYGAVAARLGPGRLPEQAPSSRPAGQPANSPAWRPAWFDRILSLFILLFLSGHALFSFQVWDRYLLGLIPLLALLLARILLLPWLFMTPMLRPDWLRPVRLAASLGLALLLALTLARPVQDAVNARYPLGSNSQALQGIEQIVAYLQGQVGANHTLYHRWLGDHWRFYLWGYPYDLQYWASPRQLAAQAQPGYLIAFPSWQSETEARLALAQAGLTLHELVRAYHPAGYPSIILYRIERTPW